MRNDYPTFPDHQSVICFNCDAAITGGRNSGYHDGGFVADCPNCKMHTFYSLQTDAMTQIDQYFPASEWNIYTETDLQQIAKLLKPCGGVTT